MTNAVVVYAHLVDPDFVVVPFSVSTFRPWISQVVRRRAHNSELSGSSQGVFQNPVIFWEIGLGHRLNSFLGNRQAETAHSLSDMIYGRIINVTHLWFDGDLSLA